MYDEIEGGDRIERKIMVNLFFEVYERLISFHRDSAETRYIKILEEKGELIIPTLN